MAETTCGQDDRMSCLYQPPCPEHAQRHWAGQRLATDLHEAVYGDSWARTETPADMWRVLLREVRALATGPALAERKHKRVPDTERTSDG